MAVVITTTTGAGKIQTARGSNLSPVEATHNHLTVKLNTEALKSFSLCESPLSDWTNQHPYQVKLRPLPPLATRGTDAHPSVATPTDSKPETAAKVKKPDWPDRFSRFSIGSGSDGSVNPLQTECTDLRNVIFAQKDPKRDINNAASPPLPGLYQTNVRHLELLHPRPPLELFPFTTLHFKTVDKIFVS